MLPDISMKIWDGKYRFKDADGSPIDKEIDDTWRRVATALAVNEKAPQQWAPRFMDIMASGKFSPAGRIIAGAGTGRNVTLSNCFVMGTIPDSMGGIFDMLKEAALTMQAGGGIGYCFSTLRPKGALVKGVGADASGPLSFMDVWNSMCMTIMSAGNRRGAMMATMHCYHPDIEDFIAVKQDPLRLRKFNLSVLVTDEFMHAVKHDMDWHLHFNGNIYNTVRAKDLWEKILRSTYEFAEPGIIFIDRVNKTHNLNYISDRIIAATNPCGEQPMPPYSSCLLGSVNLAKFIVNPFTEIAEVDWKDLEETVRIAIRMMDNVVDVNTYPLEEQTRVSKAERRLGLGFTGLADALIMLSMRYGTKEAQGMAHDMMRTIALAAYDASIELAIEKGPFPLFDAIKYLSGETFANTKLPDGYKDRIRKHGIRNCCLVSIAPTGTISLFAGNVSSGIEPVFALGYERKVLQPDGSHVVERVEDYAVAEFYRRHDRGTELPESFVTAQTLKPIDHLVMQAAVQEWVDSSISKTINVPEDISFEDFGDIYMQAYELGCKGCTTYRPNDITGSVISVEKKDVATEAVGNTPVDVHNGSGNTTVPSGPTLTKRPKELPGVVSKIKFGDEAAIYVTMTDIEEDGIKRPYEVFLNTKNPKHHAWAMALTRMVSAIFRRGGDVSFVPEELKQVFDPQGGMFAEGRFMPSVPAALGWELERHMKAIGYLSDPEANLFAPEVPSEAPKKALLCEKCASDNVTLSGGCPTCGDCGHSKCG